MKSEPYWPLKSFTERQQKKYDEAWGVALAQAGGINKLATMISALAGEYVSHQAIRGWRRSYRVPVQWALVIEEYTDGDANFFDLIPWLLPRTVRYHHTIEDQQKS
jgi:hypothetical protein